MKLMNDKVVIMVNNFQFVHYTLVANSTFKSTGKEEKTTNNSLVRRPLTPTTHMKWNQNNNV